MINVDEKGVEANGTFIDLIAEYSLLTHALFETGKFSKDELKRAFEAGLLTDEERKAKVKALKEETLKCISTMLNGMGCKTEDDEDSGVDGPKDIMDILKMLSGE